MNKSKQGGRAGRWKQARRAGGWNLAHLLPWQGSQSCVMLWRVSDGRGARLHAGSHVLGHVCFISGLFKGKKTPKNESKRRPSLTIRHLFFNFSLLTFVSKFPPLCFYGQEAFKDRWWNCSTACGHFWFIYEMIKFTAALDKQIHVCVAQHIMSFCKSLGKYQRRTSSCCYNSEANEWRLYFG